jgi:signal transduction histidine kinase
MRDADAREQERQIFRATTRKYALALVLIAIVAALASVLRHQVIESQRHYAAVINLSGRQRMLSQRIALFSVRMLAAQDGVERERLRPDLVEASRLMGDSHRALTHGDASLGLSRPPSPAIRALYFDKPIDLDRKVAHYLGLAGQVADVTNHDTRVKFVATNEIADLASGPLLADLDEVVLANQRESEARLRQLERVDEGIVVVVWAVLCGLGLCVLHPMTLDLVGFFRETRRSLELVAEQEARTVAAKQMLAASKMSALGEMAAGVAHEINNPLFIVMLHTVSLQRLAKVGAVDPYRLGSVLERIHGAADRIARITRGLLMFSTPEHGGVTEVHLEPLVDEALALCRERFKQQGVETVVPPIDEELKLEGSESELLQVLVHLLTNAFDAAISSEGPRWVKVECEDRDDTVRLSVSDSGAGIPQELREKIMQPFFTTKPPGKGSGLGLSVASGILEGRGGRLFLDVSSEHTRFVAVCTKKQAGSGEVNDGRVD